MNDDLRERLAEYAHTAWSGWMRYLFSKTLHESITGGEIIPQWAVERWTRQMNTPYADLPESEKDSDRQEADQMIAIMGQAPAMAIPNEVQEALKGILVFSVPAPNVQNPQKWYDAVEVVTEWCAGLPQAPQPDWSRAPGWAEWAVARFTHTPNDQICMTWLYTDTEPVVPKDSKYRPGVKWKRGETVPIPFGVDPRTLKVRRPHQEARHDDDA